MAKIMIVDDMIEIQEILEEILSIKGHSVISAAMDGQQAIDYITKEQNEKPDLIIMDHRMPIVDGITALQEILAIDSDLKIIFVSADESARKKALQIGAVDYLIKPFSIKVILKKIADLVH
jgi:two-component system chemotaxis response regulator CheY